MSNLYVIAPTGPDFETFATVRISDPDVVEFGPGDWGFGAPRTTCGPTLNPRA